MVLDINYNYAALLLAVGYGIFRVASWVISTAIKIAFYVAFISLGVLAMSSTVGLM
ncbi:TPA: hypothetical protein HA219_03790 [Candidatus Woesearchaeota archaeon]|nr:hypothetical protein [uncultured archaeon]MBS3115833.1 hypothetical protein [Candidatus Woesearchaeota archaeon]HIH39813.1 hypothetical protein [Candidatus Woesearchaeota archaeon]